MDARAVLYVSHRGERAGPVHPERGTSSPHFPANDHHGGDAAQFTTTTTGST
jgi:hypothetical protein